MINIQSLFDKQMVYTERKKTDIVQLRDVHYNFTDV